MKIKLYIIKLILLLVSFSYSNTGAFSISRIHYDGGGDWYANKSSIPNLLNFIKNNTNININTNEINVRIGDDLFFKNNFFYITGHGNIKLKPKDIIILREHLMNGAFLHVDDNYGLDKSFRKLVKELFPEKELSLIPKSHDLFHCYYSFENGLPKIHEHDNKPPQALGIFEEEKLILLYTYESDLGDGWEDKSVHNNPENLRQEALKMGTNIIIYSMIQ